VSESSRQPGTSCEISLEYGSIQIVNKEKDLHEQDVALTLAEAILQDPSLHPSFQKDKYLVNPLFLSH
jgi:hypothetical protein